MEDFLTKNHPVYWAVDFSGCLNNRQCIHLNTCIYSFSLHGKCCPRTGNAALAQECFQAACFDRTGSLKRLCRCQTCQTGSIFGNHQFFVGGYHHCQRIITFSNNACLSETSFCIELIVNLQAQET